MNIQNKQIKYHFICIGAGGTGTYFLGSFNRFLSTLDGNRLKSITALTVIDGDEIELKNCSRQLFYKEDIGRSKASVIAEVMNEELHDMGSRLCWNAYSSYLLDTKMLEEILSSTNSSDCIYIPVVLGCVDNHSCRLLIEEVFYKTSTCNLFYFDSANEFETGECVYSYKLNGQVLSPCRSHYFPDIKENKGKARDELSCEELNQVAPQHIATNMLAGQMLLSAACNLIEGSSQFFVSDYQTLKNAAILTPGFSMFNGMRHTSEFIPYRK